MKISCTCAGKGICIPCLIKAQAQMSGKGENAVAREMADKAIADDRKMKAELDKQFDKTK